MALDRHREGQLAVLPAPRNEPREQLAVGQSSRRPHAEKCAELSESTCTAQLWHCFGSQPDRSTRSNAMRAARQSAIFANSFEIDRCCLQRGCANGCRQGFRSHRPRLQRNLVGGLCEAGFSIQFARIHSAHPATVAHNIVAPERHRRCGVHRRADHLLHGNPPIHRSMSPRRLLH